MTASMRSRSPLASVRPGSPASRVWSLRVQVIRSPGLAWAPSAMRTAGPGCDDAQGDEVVADAAGQLAAQRVLGRHQQGVGAVGGQGDVGGRGGVHHLLGVAAEDAAVLVVVGQHGGVAVAQPQAGVPVPRRRGTGPVRRAGRSRGRRRAGTCRRRSRPPAAGWCPRPGSPSRRGPGRRRSGRPGPGRASWRPRRPAAAAAGRSRPGRGRRAGPGRWPRNWALL